MQIDRPDLTLSRVAQPQQLPAMYYAPQSPQYMHRGNFGGYPYGSPPAGYGMMGPANMGMSMGQMGPMGQMGYGMQQQMPMGPMSPSPMHSPPMSPMMGHQMHMAGHPGMLSGSPHAMGGMGFGQQSPMLQQQHSYGGA